MTDQSLDALRDAAWSAITGDRVGFLAADLSDAQPMTAFTDATARRLYFFTRSDTDLAQRVADGGEIPATFLFASKDKSTHVVVRGALSISTDTHVIDALWSPMVAAWFERGRTDPKVTLLAFDCGDADLWRNQGGPLKFAFEIVKANLTPTTPNLGSRTQVEM
ncbi:MAG: pyridoxamine 5'-phosphate oxidase family protein [Alphaproteobacteria bacterium]|nr:pyridoxamine 5'-phosphate oxidase family protein [Alphaproteobacteria bacterium]